MSHVSFRKNSSAKRFFNKQRLPTTEFMIRPKGKNKKRLDLKDEREKKPFV
jgi:hypothetical protein